MTTQREIDTHKTEQTDDVELNLCDVYEICIDGHLDARWAEWFSDFEMTLQEDGTTMLTGFIVDQAALYGFLRKIRDCGMPLLSLRRIDHDNFKNSAVNTSFHKEPKVLDEA